MPQQNDYNVLVDNDDDHREATSATAVRIAKLKAKLAANGFHDDYPDQVYADYLTAHDQAAKRMPDELPVVFFAAVLAGKALVEYLFNMTDTRLTNLAKINTTFAFTGSTIFALCLTAKSIYHRHLIDQNLQASTAERTLVANPDQGLGTALTVDEVLQLSKQVAEIEFANDLKKAALITGVGGLFFLTLGAMDLGIGFLQKIAADNTNEMAGEFGATAVKVLKNAALGTFFPNVIKAVGERCGLAIDFPPDFRMENNGALVAMPIAELAVSMTFTPPSALTPYEAQLVTAALEAASLPVGALTGKALYHCLPPSAPTQSASSQGQTFDSLNVMIDNPIQRHDSQASIDF